jgi:hypothetical protein
MKKGLSAEEYRKIVLRFKRTQLCPEEWNNFCKRYAERDITSAVEWIESFSGEKIPAETLRMILKEELYKIL